MNNDRKCRSKHPIASEWMDKCHFCKLAVTNPAYRAWGDGATPPVRAKFELPVCPNRGDPTGETRPCPTCTGTVAVPLLSCSVHGECTDSKLVAGVKCCRICPDRPVAPVTGADPWKNLVSVPVPGPWQGTPTSKRAVVTVASGAKGKALFAISGPSMRAYAERLGADLVVIEEAPVPSWGMSAKFLLAPVLERYERVIYADADVLFRKDCLNLFEACGEDELGGYNDLPEILPRSSGFPEEYMRVRESQGLPRTRLPWYVNTGVMVLSQAHAKVLSTPPKPIPPLHCAEQHWWVGRMLDLGVRVKLLPDRFNFQWWVHRDMRKAPKDAVLHFSGMGDDAKRLIEMRKWVSAMRKAQPQEGGGCCGKAEKPLSVRGAVAGKVSSEGMSRR